MKSSKKNIPPILNDPEKIVYNAMTDFYNTYDYYFQECESEIGVNLWFIEQYRLNFRLLSLNNKNNLSKNKSKKERSKKVFTIIRIINELFFMFFQLLKKNTKPKGEHLIISNASHYVNGKNKYIGDLLKNYDYIINRSFLELNTTTYQKEYPKNKISSDALIMSRIINAKIIKDYIIFRKGYKKLKNKLIARNKITPNINNDIVSLFLKNQISHLLYFIRYRAYRDFFKNNSFQSVIMSDENSPQQKVIQYAARQQKIKIIAIQHGNIHIHHPAYIYDKYNSPPILPDKTMVWGRYFKSILTDHGGYHPDTIHITGRIQLPNTKRIINPQLNLQKNIILFISQPIRDQQTRIEYMNDVFETFSRLSDDYQLIIRPHPREVDDNYFTDLADSIGFNNYIIDRKTDLQSHMELCNAMIVAFSTVGTEFIPYFKPLLILDYKKQDIMHWIDRGLGIPIYSKIELFNKLYHNNLEVDIEKHKDFTTNYFYNNDNLSEQRIMNFINSSTR